MKAAIDSAVIDSFRLLGTTIGSLAYIIVMKIFMLFEQESKQETRVVKVADNKTAEMPPYRSGILAFQECDLLYYP
jgi:hypothetical protein